LQKNPNALRVLA